ncbi:MAG: UdgX family uracil-DNA binding protein [Candidatus Dormibacteraeota bacterium]|nr:UdgX family uracil-DNA binding protein [Candidatus Dormibacteraeota bacterium]
MVDEGQAVAQLLPDDRSLDALKEAAAGCRACDLWEKGTQTVFGEGPPQARVVMVGEQPGDQEDRVGKPFVGPAGQILDEALKAAEIDRSLVYVTNVVKHFKWEPRGKRRLHLRPDREEVAACLPWFEAEIAAVQPRVIVCLGATAAQALLGSGFRVTRERGQLLASTLGPPIMATVHPSSILRAADEPSRRLAMDHFIADLRLIREYLG